MPKFYIEDENKKPIPVDDIRELARWFETNDKVVIKTKVKDCEVSTVFLGLNHRIVDAGKPLIYETLVFGGEFDGEMNLYSTRKEAKEGHKQMVKMISDRDVKHG